MKVRAKKDIHFNGQEIKQGQIIEVGEGLKDHLPKFLEEVVEEEFKPEGI